MPPSVLCKRAEEKECNRERLIQDVCFSLLWDLTLFLGLRTPLSLRHPKLLVVSWYRLLRLASDITAKVESEHKGHIYTMEIKEMCMTSGILFYFLRSVSLIVSYHTIAGHSTVKREASRPKASQIAEGICFTHGT